MSKLMKEEKGYALIIVLLIIVVIAIITPPIVSSMINSSKQFAVSDEVIQNDRLTEMAKKFIHEGRLDGLSDQKIVEENNKVNLSPDHHIQMDINGVKIKITPIYKNKSGEAVDY
ncbi:hypothetical protein [Cytobacillus purgationiresistens]|uniref:Tfp pilus assembly protein PilX n=1 Tax=Cytobacillus purgationiresistens TaxID=863449 RepID=A0ABU0AGR8_9BACI|nr:hypothetical protein [Cytobacillus purgationiresistens]MDQ0269992.1 Tfp pilus assembly protein PilX [Cytobacillus purgationiresistens]